MSGLTKRARRVVGGVYRPIRQKALKLQTKVLRAWRQVSTPIRSEELRSALEQVTNGGTEILLVHSSLSSCGRFTDGPEGVLSAFREFCDTLCLPTHTYCYPTSPDEAGPLFDAVITPSQNGLLTEVFRTQPGVVRSIHATHSLAVSGPIAREVCADHYRQDCPCGSGTPYSRLIQRSASALMFGVTFQHYTFFHTAEFESGSEYAYEHGTLDRLRVVDENGAMRDCWSRRQYRGPMRFAEAGDLLERVGLARRVKLGRSALLFVPDCLRVHDFLVERLSSNPDFLRQSCKRELQ
jgi:aminoglycoside 3-N-acetyltransferase